MTAVRLPTYVSNPGSGGGRSGGRAIMFTAAGRVLVGVLLAGRFPARAADDPPVLNPFAPRPAVRSDAIPGVVELSDGSLHAGRVYLTRDMRLRVYDQALHVQREIPLRAVRRIDCSITRQWTEKEWRFKEAANNEKVYTGRQYPAREYLHTLTLRDGRTVKGTLSAIVYLQPGSSSKPEKLVLHKRDKGTVGQTQKDLTYVRSIRLSAPSGRKSNGKTKSNAPRGAGPGSR